MMSRAEKTRENRLRRMLDRRGYRLLKSYARDQHDITFGGYQIVDIEHGKVVAGQGNVGRGYAFDMGEVEAWITAHNRGEVGQ